MRRFIVLCCMLILSVGSATVWMSPSAQAASRPYISSLTPARGNPDVSQRIIIRGGHFTRRAKVTIGGAAAKKVVYYSSTKLAAYTKVWSEIEQVQVRVTAGGLTSRATSRSVYTFAPPALPTSAPPVDLSRASWDSITVGLQHSCGIRSDGEAWCWGDNSNHQSGWGPYDGTTRMARVDEPGPWKLLDATGTTTCGIKVDGTAWCWGANSFGQTGQPYNTDLYPWKPREVALGGTWSDIEVGDEKACGVRTDTTLWCWGSGFPTAADGPQDQQDYLTDETRNADFRRVKGEGWATVSVDDDTACGIKVDGTLWCFGYARPLDWSHLTPIGPGMTWKSVSVLSGHSACAIRSDSALLCWGPQLWSWTEDSVPRPVPNGAGAWEQISSSAEVGLATCGVKEDGTAWCWGVHGSYPSYAMGSGSRAASRTPLRVADIAAWSSVAPGDMHSCGIKADGSAWCWGNDGAGTSYLGFDGDSARLPRQIMDELAPR